MGIELPEIPQGITVYFDDEHPLGPVAAEHVKDEAVAAFLTSIENDAFKEISQGTSILYGRKGAGKSSILRSFTYPSRIKTTTRLSIDEPSASHAVLSGNSELRRKYDLVIEVDAAKEFSSVHEMVVKDGYPGPELAANHWKERLWTNVLFSASRRADIIDRLDATLRNRLIRVAQLTSVVTDTDSAGAFLDEWAKRGGDDLEVLGALAEDLRRQFERNKISVLFLIDSIENYNFLASEALKLTVGGLLFLVGGPRSHISYKVAFPYEAHDEIRRQGNPEKIQLNSFTMRWKTIELVRIATRRMLLCLYIYENESLEEVMRAATHKGLGRSAHFDFWTSVFGDEITNEAHHPEHALYYVLRHTQLLPRQLILALNSLLSMSKTPRNSFRYVNPDIVTAATKISSNALIGGIDAGFKSTYPDLDRALDRFLPRSDICSSYSDLHRLFNASAVRGAHEYTSEFYSFMRFLLHIGAFGIVDEKLETERYIVAQFCYGDDSILRKFENKRFAMHPAFSLLYKDTEDRLSLGKAVLPRGTVDEVA